MAKPQLVFVPGCWHTPKAFSVLIPKLEAIGYTVHVCHLASVGNEENPTKDLTPDIEAVQKVVTQAIGDGNDVMVVPHSWGGFVAGSALSGFGKKEREAKGEKGGVVRAVYLCAFMAPEGVSLMDKIGNKSPDWWSLEGELAVTNHKAADVFYADLPESKRLKWYSELQKHSAGSIRAKAKATSWKEIPTSYLICENDLAIPVFAQDAMTGMVKEQGGEIEVKRIKSGHSPFLSHPEAVVEWIQEAAERTP